MRSSRPPTDEKNEGKGEQEGVDKEKDTGKEGVDNEKDTGSDRINVST